MYIVQTVVIGSAVYNCQNYLEIKFRFFSFYQYFGITQLVKQLAKGRIVWGSNPSGGDIFYTHLDQPWAHPASYTNGTESVPVVKQPGCGVDNPSPYSLEVKETVKLYIYSASGPLWPV